MNQFPLVLNIMDMPLWQLIYTVTLVLFFVRATKDSPISNQTILWSLTPFSILSVANTILSLDHNFKVVSYSWACKNEVVFYFYKGLSFVGMAFSYASVLISGYFVILKKSDRSTTWLKLIWFFMSILFVYNAVLETHRFIYGDRVELTSLWILVSIFLYWLIYTGIYKFKLTNDQFEIRNLLKETKMVIKQVKESNSETSHLKNLTKIIEEEHLYRDPYLSRDDVAEKLSISGGYLSQLLSKDGDQNFSDFINSYRVDDVKSMMARPEFDRYSLLSIGLEAGFNSKTTFYSSFKKATGMTPSEYKKAN